MRILKNCPNCGGILDDEGRCMYCKSKVYDLTGININLENRDVVLFKIKQNGYDIIMKGYPTSVDLSMEPQYTDVYGGLNTPLARFQSGVNMTAKMEFQIIADLNDDNDMVEIRSR